MTAIAADPSLASTAQRAARGALASGSARTAATTAGQVLVFLAPVLAGNARSQELSHSRAVDFSDAEKLTHDKLHF